MKSNALLRMVLVAFQILWDQFDVGRVHIFILFVMSSRIHHILDHRKKSFLLQLLAMVLE